MAYIDNLDAPTPKRVKVSYGGPSPVDVNGNPNSGYNGNTGVNGWKPSVAQPPIDIPKPPTPPGVVTGGGGGPAGGGASAPSPHPSLPPPPTPPNAVTAGGGGGAGFAVAKPKTPASATAPSSGQAQFNTYAQALDALYKKYFFRPPTAQELSTHFTGLSKGYGTLQGIEAELQREAARLGLKPPTSTPPTTPDRGTAPAGVDPGKWASGHTSPKYAFMEVSQRYDQRTPEGRQQTLAELQQRYPQWFTGWIIDGDKLRHASGTLADDFDGYNEFDAWGASGAGVWSPQWIPTQRGGQAYVDPATQAQQAAQAAAQQVAQQQANAGAGGTQTAGAGGGSALPPGGAPGLTPISGQLGGAGGVDFGVTGPYGYDDPSTRQLEEMLRLLIDEKTNPIDDPARNEYANALRQRFLSIIEPGSGANPASAALDAQLQAAIASLGNAPTANTAAGDFDRELQAILATLKESSAYTPNAAAGDFDRQLLAAIESLTNPALTANDRARLENRALEPMERDRQIRMQQQKERMAAMGHGESSGTIASALGDVDRDFDRRRGEVQRDLSIYEREQDDARRREAIGYGAQRTDVMGRELARRQQLEAERRGEITSVSSQRMTAAEREMERQRQVADANRREALTLGGQRRDLIATEQDRERGRYSEALTMAEALSNLSGQQRSEQDARMREALTYVSLFPEMDERRLRLAMETLGMSNGMASAPSIFSTLSNLQAQAHAAGQQGQQQNAAFWNQLGQWMAQNWGSSK